MGVTPVCTLNSTEIGVIGGVANNPVPLWILCNGVIDNTFGKRLTFLVEDF